MKKLFSLMALGLVVSNISLIAMPISTPNNVTEEVVVTDDYGIATIADILKLSNVSLGSSDTTWEQTPGYTYARVYIDNLKGSEPITIYLKDNNGKTFDTFTVAAGKTATKTYSDLTTSSRNDYAISSTTPSGVKNATASVRIGTDPL
ncbi:MAG: hypothetical protein ATN36_06135 [Epulopiscium sp. Nele67-Bin005]|nr:MAG: hypothetical protein ATN36_06135 [Epulopiscium sp. Nele67-Bin005]